MIHELLARYTTAYSNMMGSSKVFVVMLVALLFLYINRKKLGFNPFILIMAPLCMIAASASRVFMAAKKKRNKCGMAFAIFLCAFVIMLTGDRIYSPEHMSKTENTMHIPEGYKAAMDYMLQKKETPKVLAMPDYSMYHALYSSKFDMLYEQRYGDDVRYLSEGARNAYAELSDLNPDMMVVSDAASDYDCDYIVLKEGHYWPMFPLDKYDYELEANVEGWDIYSRKEVSD